MSMRTGPIRGLPCMTWYSNLRTRHIGWTGSGRLPESSIFRQRDFPSCKGWRLDSWTLNDTRTYTSMGEFAKFCTLFAIIRLAINVLYIRISFWIRFMLSLLEAHGYHSIGLQNNQNSLLIRFRLFVYIIKPRAYTSHEIVYMHQMSMNFASLPSWLRFKVYDVCLLL